jgi:hypothetical protein
MDEDTKVIPGHGPLADRSALESYQTMLATVHGRIGLMIDEGLSLEQIKAQKPTAEFDAEWGDGFISPDQWVELIHGDIVGT